MILSVPLKIVVEDDPKNPPEIKKVAMSFHLKVPRSCDLSKVKELLIQKYPKLQYMISVLYYINSGKYWTTKLLGFPILIVHVILI